MKHIVRPVRVYGVVAGGAGTSKEVSANGGEKEVKNLAL
jgi:hypothetical protein